MSTKPRCEKELHIEKYFGLPADVSPEQSMHLKYANLVDLLYSWEQSPTTEPVEEKEDGLDRGNYWKERCMAAEKCIHLLGSWSQPSGQHHNYQMAYSDWQTFKKLKDENE